MLTVDLQLSGLPIRQHPDEAESMFALSADDGANLLDDDQDEVIETYGTSDS